MRCFAVDNVAADRAHEKSEIPEFFDINVLGALMLHEAHVMYPADRWV